MDHRFANFSRAGNPNDMKVKNVFKKSSYLVLVICFINLFDIKMMTLIISLCGHICGGL